MLHLVYSREQHPNNISIHNEEFKENSNKVDDTNDVTRESVEEIIDISNNTGNIKRSGNFQKLQNFQKNRNKNLLSKKKFPIQQFIIYSKEYKTRKSTIVPKMPAYVQLNDSLLKIIKTQNEILRI